MLLHIVLTFILRVRFSGDNSWERRLFSLMLDSIEYSIRYSISRIWRRWAKEEEWQQIPQKAGQKMRHNARHYCLSLPTMMSCVTEAWSSDCNVPGSAGAQVCSCLESHHNWRCSPGLRLSAGRSTCELSPVLFWPQLTQLPVNIIFDQIFPFLNSWKLLFTQSRVQIYKTGGCGPLLKFWSQLFES